MNTGSAADYLRAIYDIVEEGVAISNATLARALNVRPPSVTGMMKRLAREGLVTGDHGRLRLTPRGARMAQRSIRRHRLVETWLVRSLGLDWSSAHDEAHQLEHALSAGLEATIADKLGHPRHDPHGAPIPDADGRATVSPGIPLSLMRNGAVGAVVRLSDRSAEKLAYWSSLGIALGVRVRRGAESKFGGPVELSVGDRRIFVGPAALEGIWVRTAKAPRNG